MSKTNTLVKAGRPMPLDFASVSGLYALTADSTANDVLDQLQARLLQLRAMLCMTTGHAFDSFNEHSEELRQAYMYNCSLAADECGELLRVMCELREKEQKTGA